MERLPESPGVLSIRGARQFGKSTWLEGALRDSIVEYGPGSSFYLNGDEIADADALTEAIRGLLPAFSATARVRRLFIDEITAVAHWESSLKRLIDAGELRGVLVVTTGSKARDLRRGAERLPGRKGRLARTQYIFTPISFGVFKEECGEKLGENILPAYILSGGAAPACAELAKTGLLPEYRIETVRDWVYGECAAEGRSRRSLLAVIGNLFRLAGGPISQAKLAREAGMANNTVAAGYIEFLSDLLCLGQTQAWNPDRGLPAPRKTCKYPFVNLLAATSFHPARPRAPEDFRALDESSQAILLEWVVAQELWRRAAIRGVDMPESLAFWRSKNHELDYVVAPDEFVEVKRGTASPLEFSWFAKTFPRARLTVICSSRFETDQVRAISLEDFLSESP